MTSPILRLAAMAAACALATSAHAATVFSNGAPDGISGSDIETSFVSLVADDFVLTAAAHLTGATVDLTAFDASVIQSAPINYEIFADTGAGPGVLLTSGVGQNLRFSDLGNFGGSLDVQGVSFDFESAFDAAANTTYWFGINAGTEDRVFWASTPLNGSRLTEYIFPDHPGVFTTNVQPTLENAFTLEAAGAVPEPASWALMIGGAGLAGAALRRRRRSAAAAA